MTPSTIDRRWSLVNRNTGTTRVSKYTRNEARAAKRRNERIYDEVNSTFVR